MTAPLADDGIIEPVDPTAPPVPASAIRNTAWNFADLIIGLIGSTFVSILVARALGPTILGRYQFVVWMAGTVATLSTSGVPAASIRNLAAYLATNQPGLAGALVRRTLHLQAILAGGALSIGVVLTFILLKPGERLFGVLAFATLVPSLMMAVPTSINALDDRFRRNVIPSLVDITVVVIGVIITIEWHFGLVGLAAASLVARICDSGLRFWMARHRMASLLAQATVLPREEGAKFARMAREAAVMQVLAFIVWNRSEIFFLQLFSTNNQIAFFSLAYGWATKPSQLPTTAASVLNPAILRSYHVDEKIAVATAARSTRLQALISYPVYFTFAIIAAPAITLMYSTPYLRAIPFAIILTLATMAPSGRGALEILLRAADRQRPMVVVYVGTSILTLLLDWILIKHYGGLGAAIANGTIQIVQAVWVLVLGLKYTSMRWRDLSLGKPFLLAGLAAAIAVGVTWHWATIPALVVRPLLLASLFGATLWVFRERGLLTRDERDLIAEQITRGRTMWRELRAS